ncbi:hypothetical protein N7460_009382 [Penicillium canescens]|uniref:DNA repair protein Rad26 n=1 Tax=Penicillium canescens TaxID=5083 RepID=A0AAD6I796_PENCN|nr:hypothetical protein N7460_009382 [Penicillium canescens]KAJ6046864.1 hypothetical protein N7444_008118 [Penicillium canescens]
MDDDDDYGSDEFDSLPPGTLYELEQNAFQATQATASQHFSVPSINSNSVLRAHAAPSNHTGSLRPPPRLHTGLTNEYNTLEVGELEAEVYDNVDGQHAVPYGHHAPATDIDWTVNGEMGDAMELDEGYGQVNMTEINARLAQMEQEREQMIRELAEAKDQVAMKTGEISIIRSKQTRMTQDYDRQLAALRKSLADEAASHKLEVEAAMSEGKVLATENVFLQQELVEEAYQARNYKTRHRNEDKAAPVTPRKSRILPFRDGFDDDEIAVVSPSKSATRSKRATPTVPGKRKRQASQDSPTPLELNPAGAELIMTDASVDAAEVAQAKRKSAQSGRNQRFMMRLLSHKMHPSEETDLEAMAKLAFPSEPDRSMSRIVMDSMAHVDMDSYIVEYTQAIASLWQRAINEKFYEPIPRFASIVRFILMSDDTPLPEIIIPLVGVLQDSVEVNAVPRFKYAPASRDKRVAGQTPQSDLQPLVDSTEALRLLYRIACGVLHNRRALQTFWENIRISFILVMLHPSHPLGDIVLLMNLLSTSIRPNSFGSIRTSDQDQLDVQKWIVDRLTHMLSEPAIPDEGVEPYTPYDICAMRLEVLLLLESLAFSPTTVSQGHASAILALHPNALARLFRSMHDELDALYSYPPSKTCAFP